MQAVEIQTQARMLFEAHGARAIVEANKKAKDCEQSGDKAGASDRECAAPDAGPARDVSSVRAAAV